MRIGVLAVQGAFAEHEQMLNRLGVEHFQIRQKRDLELPFNGLILPGGESTVMGKLLRELGLFEPLNLLIKSGFPVFGTCAGLILLAQKVSNNNQTHFASMSIKVRRNAYGRQLGSFKVESSFDGLGKIPMTFIRAPFIEQVWDDTQVLSIVDGNIVAAKQGNNIVTAFHPELTDNVCVHKYFIEIVNQYISANR
jgi:5'-phosphate synthase pdxT subunit